MRASLFGTLITTPLVCMTVLNPGALAADWIVPNLRVTGGAGWMQSVNVKSFTHIEDVLSDPATWWGPWLWVDRYKTELPVQSRQQFDPGPQMQFAFGGPLRDPSWLRLEVEGGFTLNGWQMQGADTLIRGSVWTTPLLVNALVDWDLDHRWTLFAGGGGGFAVGGMSVDRRILTRTDGTALRFDGTGYAFLGVYQGMAGVQYRVSPTVAMNLSYRFYGTTPATWTYDGKDWWGLGPSWRMKTGPAMSHGVMIGVDWSLF
jgi:opacity protein-like surface antigen